MVGDLCSRLEVQQPDAAVGGKGVIYVKSRWLPNRFSLSISDGFDAWICEASEDEVKRKAFSWDWSVPQYLQDAEKHLGVQDPLSTYTFASTGDGSRKLSWSLMKDGVQLVAHWRVEASKNPKELTCSILDYLIRGSSRISEELQRKKRTIENLKAESERAIAQSQRFKDEKVQFETDMYKKFVAVLNSKKSKLREFREIALHSRAADEATKGGGGMTDEMQSSEDELDDSDGEDELPSEGRARVEGAGVHVTEKRDSDDEDSGATDIIPSDSPMADVSNVEPAGQPELDASDTLHQSDRLQVSNTRPLTRSLDHPQREAVDVTDAASLLGGSTYTSAPKKRRHL